MQHLTMPVQKKSKTARGITKFKNILKTNMFKKLLDRPNKGGLSFG